MPRCLRCLGAWRKPRQLAAPRRLPVTAAAAWVNMSAELWEAVLSVIVSVTEMRVKLEELRSEHRDLDDVIQQLLETSPFNQLQIQRLKKRKLALKDQIAKLESKLLPDIIA